MGKCSIFKTERIFLISDSLCPIYDIESLKQYDG